MSSARDPLDSLINQWRKVEPPVPNHEQLTHEVWRRIADAEIAPEPGFLARLESTFRRPSFALAFVAACTVFGLFLAEVRVSRQQSLRNVQLAHAYLQLIDPLVNESVVSSETTASSTRAIP